ncbi:hypothetical protein B0T14DRAFT_431665 [Immersiella caudata]|uniref:Uncharacterized protein n=1 Tax=Immersiella caudata TaxID=314043 RepID=A0AA39WQE6_9PEZI|nr:hypothetical protein B0T14DRAFT_431665 [Immersiella caudata]
MGTLLPSRLLIRAVISIASLSGAAFYFTRQRFNQKCPRIPLSALPESSACRNLLDTNETLDRQAWGLLNSRLLASWPGSNNASTHWIPSFTAVHVEIPVVSLAGSSADGDRDLLPLVKNLVAAFLDARAAGPESWILDREVPALSFSPGHHLFGTTPEPGAFLLGTWSSISGEGLEPPALPSDAPRPVASFPSNRGFLDAGEHEAAGLVLYWRAVERSVQAANRGMGRIGLPWRVMEGGFQELIVERVSEGTLRVTYVSVEASRIADPRGERSFGRLPWLLYEMHVMYAQHLLLGAVGKLGAIQ